MAPQPPPALESPAKAVTLLDFASQDESVARRSRYSSNRRAGAIACACCVSCRRTRRSAGAGGAPRPSGNMVIHRETPLLRRGAGSSSRLRRTRGASHHWLARSCATSSAGATARRDDGGVELSMAARRLDSASTLPQEPAHLLSAVCVRGDGRARSPVDVGGQDGQRDGDLIQPRLQGPGCALPPPHRRRRSRTSALTLCLRGGGGGAATTGARRGLAERTGGGGGRRGRRVA